MVATTMATVATTRATVATRAMEVLEDMERVTEELAHTPMVVQVLYMVCQDMGGRGDTTHRLQPMVPNLLPMIHNLLLMMHLVLHNHLQPMEVLQLPQGLLM